ncbi:general secretion pathway protein GspK [Pseudomonas sp. PSKL.D1]|uniref:general secretion pathway protein GspK n=1 Tax=Pseudomonas sp. PSKL.D1 TaxID=3029060 RepID=UPI0023813D06|nr:type II secretion system protein GspK [Pseudomonas sp. PSKL.D1]WDY58363.1 type II secretion system protein GspK [Pseudomonas sp. PSKL.D1]
MKAVQQRGVALVTVLLIMALVMMLIVAMVRSHQLSVAALGYQTEALRAMQLILAVERKALLRLRGQFDESLAVIHAGQPWAQAQVLELGQASVHMQVEDLAGRFNLGALVRNGRVDPVLLKRWQQLCQAMGVEPPAMETLPVDTLLDISQLRVLPGVDTAFLQRLAPWVVVLPPQAGLNINTASARMIAMLEGLEPATAKRLVAARPEAGYASVQGFLADPILAGGTVTGRGLAVGSRWFGLTLRTDLDGVRVQLYSEVELDARSDRFRVMRRALSRVPR